MAEQNAFGVGGEALGFGALSLGEKDEAGYRRGVGEIDVSTGSVHDLDLKAKFAEEEHHYITECIRVADQKAAFLFIASTGILAYLFEHKLDPLLASLPQVEEGDKAPYLVLAALVVAIGILCASAFFAAWVVRPRFTKPHRGCIFWEDITTFKSPKQFANDLMKKHPVEFVREKFENCYPLSRLCHRKYALLTWAIRCAIVGWAVTLLLLPFLPWISS